MVEVLSSNFSEVYHDLEVAVQNSDFVAIDCEFTGIIYSQSTKPSLFDTAVERYDKLSQNIDKFTIAQIGLSTFIYNNHVNTYEAKSYNIYLRPRAIGQLERRFWCQSTCLDFLCQHRFDFNKFVYEGVSFLNNDEEEEVQKILKNKDVLQYQERDVDESLFQEVCSNIAQWLTGAKVGEVYDVELPHKDVLQQYTLQSDIHARFTEDVWCEVVDTGLKVSKVTYKDRVQFESDSGHVAETLMLEHLLGFTKVFRLLVNSRKMIVGHNCLTDLMLIYHKFYKPLPASLATFKFDIISLFPLIFDTKHIALNIRGKLTSLPGVLSNTSLFALYQKFESLKPHDFKVLKPRCMHDKGCQRYINEELPHEAGYDAFLAGYVFVHLGHLLAHEERKSSTPVNSSFFEFVSLLKPMVNNLNMIRAAVDSINLQGLDPPSRRPERLLVRCKSSALRADQLSELLARFGNVDIKMQSTKQAIVAVGQHKCAKDILRAFSKDEELRIIPYNPLKHNASIRNGLWLVFLASTSVGGYLFYSGLTVA